MSAFTRSQLITSRVQLVCSVVFGFVGPSLRDLFRGPFPPSVTAKARPVEKGVGAACPELPVGKKCQLPQGTVQATPALLLRQFPVPSFQALYDHLMDFLADRGVDNTFADELIELSTALEHQEYIKFLEDLKSFVKCQ